VKDNVGECLAAKRLHSEKAAANHASIRKQVNMLANTLSRMGVKAEDLPR